MDRISSSMPAKRSTPCGNEAVLPTFDTAFFLDIPPFELTERRTHCHSTLHRKWHQSVLYLGHNGERMCPTTAWKARDPLGSWTVYTRILGKAPVFHCRPLIRWQEEEERKTKRGRQANDSPPMSLRFKADHLPFHLCFSSPTVSPANDGQRLYAGAMF